MRTIHDNLTNNINDLKEGSKYNRRWIFARARYIYKNSVCSWSEALKQAWDEEKKVVLRKREELVKMIAKLSKAICPQLPPQWAQDQLIKEQFIAYNAGTKLN